MVKFIAGLILAVVIGVVGGLRGWSWPRTGVVVIVGLALLHWAAGTF